MRFLAWLSSIALLLTCGLWALTPYRSQWLQHDSVARRLSAILTTGAFGLQRSHPLDTADGWSMGAEPARSAGLHIPVKPDTLTVEAPAPGVQLVHITGTLRNGTTCFATLLLVSWWWLLIPLSLLTSFSWVKLLSRMSQGRRGFAVTTRPGVGTE